MRVELEGKARDELSIGAHSIGVQKSAADQQSLSLPLFQSRNDYDTGIQCFRSSRLVERP
jgi:hypothetical protein